MDSTLDQNDTGTVLPHYVRRFSRERLIQQHREGKLPLHEEIHFGESDDPRHEHV